MAVDDIIEQLCEEANGYSIYASVIEPKGTINSTTRIMKINPIFWNERAETFTHEMLHHYHDNIKCDGLSNEQIIEQETLVYMKNKDNRDYILKYLDARL